MLSWWSAGAPTGCQRFSFFMHAGGVTHIPRAEEVESFVYDNVSQFQNWKCFAHYSSTHNEIMWFYVLDGR